MSVLVIDGATLRPVARVVCRHWNDRPEPIPTTSVPPWNQQRTHTIGQMNISDVNAATHRPERTKRSFSIGSRRSGTDTTCPTAVCARECSSR